MSKAPFLHAAGKKTRLFEQNRRRAQKMSKTPCTLFVEHGDDLVPVTPPVCRPYPPPPDSISINRPPTPSLSLLPPPPPPPSPLLHYLVGKNRPIKTTDYLNRARKKMWTNGATGEASEGDPTSSSAERSSTASVSAHSPLVPGTFEYNRRRNALASRGTRAKERERVCVCFS